MEGSGLSYLCIYWQWLSFWGHEVAGFDSGVCRWFCFYSRIRLENVDFVYIFGFNQVRHYPNVTAILSTIIISQFVYLLNLISPLHSFSDTSLKRCEWPCGYRRQYAVSCCDKIDPCTRCTILYISDTLEASTPDCYQWRGSNHGGAVGTERRIRWNALSRRNEVFRSCHWWGNCSGAYASIPSLLLSPSDRAFFLQA